MTDRLLQLIALPACPSVYENPQRCAHVGFPPLWLPAAFVDADLGEGFVPAMPVPLRDSHIYEWAEP